LDLIHVFPLYEHTFSLYPIRLNRKAFREGRMEFDVEEMELSLGTQ